MDRKEFDELYVGKNIVVHCLTEELANEFLGLADDFGYRWCDRSSYVEDNLWRKYGNATAYYLFEGEYSRVGFYLSENYNIVEFKSLKTKNTKNPRGFKKKKAFVKL